MTNSNRAENTKAALARIKGEIETKGFYVTKAGKTITSLRSGGFTPATIEKGRQVRAANVKARHEAMAGIIKTLADDGLTLQAIADELNQRGLKTARGHDWTATAVSRVEKAVLSLIEPH